jgi:hypothetical protein
MTLLILALLLAEEVTIRISPEPLAVTKARYGDVRGMGAWRCLICNSSAEALRVSALAVEDAITDLSIIDPESAAELLRAKGRLRRREVLGRVLEYSTLAATAAIGGGYIRVTGKEAAQLALLLGGAKMLRGEIAKGVIVLDPAKLLVGTIEIPPGDCAARILFAGLVKGRTHRYRLAIPKPRRPLAKGITSIP